MPLDFEANRGQAPSQYGFVAHGPSYALGVSAKGLALTLRRRVKKEAPSPISETALPQNTVEASELSLTLAGASANSKMVGLDPQGGSSNYFIGNDPQHWRRSVPHFNRVKITSAYPGIDLIFYGDHRQLEYDFAVSAGADPDQIRLQSVGARSVGLDSAGNAILRTPAGDVELHRPIAYQQVDGARRPVESAFQLAKGGALRFRLGIYDRTQPLIIDPVLEYAVGFGGSNANQAIGVAIDATGNAYVTGNTCSVDFPSTAGNFGNMHTNAALKDCQDAFVTKLDPTASTLMYSDYIGGSSASSSGTHIAVDASGNAFVVGATGATDFPTVANIGPTAPSACAMSKTGYTCPDAFVLKLSPDGSQLLFSTLLGGNLGSGAYQVKLNPVTGDLVVLGETNSSTFLPAPTTLETTFAGGTCTGGIPCFNSFLVALDPATGALRYASYLGGAGNDWSSGLAFDTAGNIYVAGSAQPPFASALGTVTHTYAPGGGATTKGTDLFVAKLNLASNKLTPGYITLVQGDADVGASGISVDSSGNLYFAGTTSALHLGVTAGAFQTTNSATFNTQANNCIWAATLEPFLPNACGTGLVGKLDATGALSFLTYLGGSIQDEAEAVASDSSGNVWVTGVTLSSNFPVSADHYNFQPGFGVPYLAEFSPDGTKLPFSTFIGGGSGQSTDLLIDSSNNVYVTGFATTLPSTPGVYPDNPLIFTGVFVQKWGEGAAPAITVTPSSVGFGATALGASTAPQTVTVQNTGTVPMQLGVHLRASYPGETPSDFPETTNCGSSLAPGASCTITVSFAPGPPSPVCVALQGCDPTTRSAHVLISNNAPQGAQSLGVGGLATVGASFNFAPNPIVFPAQTAGTSSAALYAQAGSTGDSPLIVGNIALSGPNASDFSLTLTGVGGPDCISAPVPAGSLCSLEVTFSPPANATGTRNATLTFTDNAGDSPQAIPITATVASANFLNLSPLTLAPSFPVAIGTSVNAALDIQNPSPTTAVQVTALVLSGASSADYTATPENCGTNGALPMTIPPNGTCYVYVAFNPAAGASGTRPATLTVQTTPAAIGLPTISLVGDAITNSQPGIKVQQFPDPLNFGGLQVGETSNPASVLLNIYNNYPIPCASSATSCGAPLVISSIAAGLSDYTIANAGTLPCNTFPVTMAIGDVCTIALVFKPAAVGSRNTTLTIQSNDPQGAVLLPLYGTGLALPLAEVLQTGLDFGNSAIGVASPPLTTTLQNAGQSNLSISGVTASPNFALTANTCTGTLAPQATCTMSVTFTPPSAGNFTGAITVSDNDQFNGQQIVTLAGTGATGPQLRITPASINFGNQPVNSLSASQTLTLASTGDTAIAFPANGIRTSTDFILQSTTCGTTLAPGATCAVSVQFDPTTVTGIAESGTVFITDNAKGSPQPVYMQGTATQNNSAASTIGLTSSANPSGIGQSVTFTAKVAGPSGNANVPTGTVTFSDYVTVLGSIALSGGQATYSTSALSAGSHAISAIYSGDANFAGSTSTVLTQVVNAASLAATTTAVSSSLNPSTVGQSVTFTAAVAGPSGNTTVPTGTATFKDGAATLGTAALTGSGQATYSASTLSAGSHSITAAYNGDANFAGSTSQALAEVVNTATLAATTTTVSSSQNPSTLGQSVTFTAAVAGPSGNTTVPTGAATFKDGAATLGTGTLNLSGQATYSSSALNAGSHSITAAYNGDANFAGSTSSALTQVVNTATLAATTTTLASSLNPSPVGQSVTFTAAIAVPSGDTTAPTGSVSFMDGATSLGSGVLNGSAQAAYGTSTLSAGSHSITAVYAGDSNFAGSTSSVLTQVVGTPNFTLSLNPTTVTVTAGLTGNTTVSVLPASGFNQQVSFACSGLPAASTCSFSPSTVTPSGNGAATTTLTVATDVSTAVLHNPVPFGHRGWKETSGISVGILLFGLGGLLSSRRRWRSVFLAVILAGALGTMLGGCGGGSGGGGGGGGGASKTPTGTTTVTVTATSGNLTQTAALTLTVN
jgi:hypothetical protein